jgi:hypothetical protein
LISTAWWSKLDFTYRDKCKLVLLRLSLAENLEKPLMPLNGTEWRETGYGHREEGYVPRLNPKSMTVG